MARGESFAHRLVALHSAPWRDRYGDDADDTVHHLLAEGRPLLPLLRSLTGHVIADRASSLAEVARIRARAAMLVVLVTVSVAFGCVLDVNQAGSRPQGLSALPTSAQSALLALARSHAEHTLVESPSWEEIATAAGCSARPRRMTTSGSTDVVVDCPEGRDVFQAWPEAEALAAAGRAGPSPHSPVADPSGLRSSHHP